MPPLNNQHDGVSNGTLFLEGQGKNTNGNGSKTTPSSEVSGLGNILVEITDGAGTLRTLTDEDGRFSFEGIRPGKCILKVHADNLPVHHYLEKATFQMELKPAESREIAVRVLPRLKPIEIIDEGKIKPEQR